MRQNFHKSLERYNTQIKDWRQAEKNQEEERTRQLDNAIDYELETTAYSRANNTETQREVFEIQKEKLGIMNELHHQLQAIDTLEDRAFASYQERKEGSRDLVFIDGKLQVTEDGIEKEVTLGEILTDGDWDIHYLLDARSVPRQIHKRYVVEEAKRKLHHLLDKQIVIDELNSVRTDSWKKNAYYRLTQENFSRNVEDRRLGFIAEILFKNMLKKTSIDHDADFEIIQADVYQDVDQKIDIIIRRKTRGRGVKIETTDTQEPFSTPEQIGIQVTLQQNEGILRRKQKQVANAKKRMEDGEIQDIMLVTVPSINIKNLVKSWISQGRPRGGPDRLWDPQEKEWLLQILLKGIFEPSEIRKMIEPKE